MRKLVIVLLAVFSLEAVAQSISDTYNTMSPYSIFGVGRLSFDGTLETRSMAGAGTAYTMPGLVNTVNPASLSNLKQTVYTLGANYEHVIYDGGRVRNTTNDARFNYIIFSVPLSGKAAVQVGIAPYTVTGYTVYSYDSLLVDGALKGSLDYYAGNGGLNMGFASLGVEVIKNFSIGASAAYLFGETRRSTYNYLEDRLTHTKIQYIDWMRGAKFKIGVNYNTALKDDIRLYLGATYEFTAGMKNERDYMRYTVDGYEDEYDEGNPQNYREKNEYSFSLPTTITAGVGVGNMKRWYVGLEGKYTEAPDWKNVDFIRSEATYKSGMRVALGGHYQPNMNSTNSYWARIRYMAGVYYASETFEVRGNEVKDMGVTLGASLPFTKIESQTMAISNFNIFLNAGSLGKNTDGLISEGYIKVGISFTLNDRWFLKHKYN